MTKFVYIVFFSITYFLSFGQVLKGGDISVKTISGNTYSTIARISINWPVSINKPYVKINWGDASPLDSLVYGGSDCTLYGATTLYYYGNHNFSANSTYTISIIDSFFVSNIVNIPNSSTIKMYLHSELNTSSVYQPNTSVDTHIICLTDSVACCDIVAYNPGSTDVDGDSLSYSIVTPPYLNYIMPPVNINAVTGSLTFTSNPNGPVSVSIKITEWRKISSVYYKIASTYQDLFFEIFNSVGFNDYSKTFFGFTISPNPTNSILNIVDENNAFQNSTIEIKNYLGQVVFTTPFTSQINLQNFSAGMYFLTVKDKDYLKTVKIIKE
jgi:hypothetical protein